MVEGRKYSEIFGADATTSSELDNGNSTSEESAGRDTDRPIPKEATESDAPPRKRHNAVIPGYGGGKLQERKILTLRDLLYIFFKHLRSITIITAVCLATALVYSFMVTPLYKAETKILVRMGREKLADQNEYSRNVNILYQRSNQDVNNELEIFKGNDLSRMVYAKLKDHFDSASSENNQTGFGMWLSRLKSRLTGNPILEKDQYILFLQQSLKVEFLAETDILLLSFSSPDPEFAAIAANAYADAFVKLRTQIYRTKKSHDFYLNQIRVYKKKVSNLVAREQGYAEKWHISQLDKEKELVLQNKEHLEAELVKAQQEVERTKTLLNGLKKMYGTSGNWIETPKMSEHEVVDRQAYLQDVDRQYFTLKLDRDRLLEKFTAKSREVQEVDTNLKKLRKQKYQSLVNILKLTGSTKQAEIDKISREIKKKKKRLDELIRAGYTLEQMTMEKNVAKDDLLNYTKKAETLRIFDDLDKSKITSLKTVSVATSPLQPYFPRKGLILLTATFFGVFLSFGLSAIKEFFTHVFRDGQDVEQILEVPLLMSINNQESK